MSPGFALDDRQVRRVLPHRLPLLQLDSAECPEGLGALRALKAVGGGDPMMVRDRKSERHLAPGALIESLAQCCGLLLRLRWLAQQGADLVAFAAGDEEAIARYDIPRSALADSHARFFAVCQPGQVLRFETRLQISRGEMHRFTGAVDGVATAEISLAFPYAG